MPNERINSFSHNDYEILDRQILFEGIFTVLRYAVRFRLFNNGFSPIVKREVVERKSAALILLYDADLDRVLLIEQFRIGGLKNSKSPWLIEIVAGIIEPDETAEKVAIREAVEEANCEILDLLLIGEYFVSPGASNEKFFIYCGRMDSQLKTGIYGLKNEHENIRTFTLTTEEAYDHIQTGEINTLPAVVSLQWLMLNRDRLRRLWQTK